MALKDKITKDMILKALENGKVSYISHGYVSPSRARKVVLSFAEHLDAVEVDLSIAFDRRNSDLKKTDKVSTQSVKVNLSNQFQR